LPAIHPDNFFAFLSISDLLLRGLNDHWLLRRKIMIMTITNLDSSNALVVDIRGICPSTSIAASGNATFGCQMSDLLKGEAKGAPVWKELDYLVKSGQATIAFAVDAADANVVDEANEL
jgi:hypothetical protein